MMRKLYLILVIVLLVIQLPCFSQNVAINTDHSPANSSAMLDVKSITKGILISRMSTASRDAIPSPADGLLIYNSSTNEFNFYNGTEWAVIVSTFISATVGSNSSAGGVAINTGGLPASNSAMLDVSDAGRGVLFPRTTTASISSPVTGLIIYNTSTQKFNYYNGSTWVEPCVTYTGISGAGGTQTAIGVAMNTTNSPVHQSAILDVSATNKGVLIPRMASADRDLILAVNGLFIYNTDNSTIEYYNGSEWRKLETTCWTCGSSTISDVDGNTYNTVQIGTQCWMKENLSTTKYRDGTGITNETDNATWAALTTEAYCDYDNDPNNSVTFGRLYNWFAVDHTTSSVYDLCPVGWHVPDDNEWTTMTDFLTNNAYGYGGSGDDIAFSVAATSAWCCSGLGAPAGAPSYNISTNNSSNFTALPGGFRYDDTYAGSEGVFTGLTINAYWWTSTVNGSSAEYREMAWYRNQVVNFGPNPWAAGFSVRCIKD